MKRSLHALLTPDVVRRFLSYVQPGSEDECWPYVGGSDTAGYGRFHPAKPFTYGSNRVTLTIKLGRDIGPGLFACHHCDNPPCCNPAHLYEGTHQQNVDDKVRRNRQHRGEGVPSAVLTAELVRDFRERFARGEYITVLAAEMGISLGTASKVVNGLSWAHAGGPIRPTRSLGRRSERERAGT